MQNPTLLPDNPKYEIIYEHKKLIVSGVSNEKSWLQTWTEASASCKTAGMKQAKIVKQTEWNELAGAYHATNFHHGNALTFSIFGKAFLYAS